MEREEQREGGKEKEKGEERDREKESGVLPSDACRPQGLLSQVGPHAVP